MAIGGGVTEVPDSEDEPFTSSPQVAPDGSCDGHDSREPLQDAPQGAACPYQASTENASDAATSSDESLNPDGQNTILASESSNNLQSTNLRSNTLAQQSHTVDSGQTHEHFPTHISTLPQNIDQGTSRTKEASVGQPVPASIARESSNVPANIQNAHPSKDEDYLPSEGGEQKVAIAQADFESSGRDSVVENTHVLDPPHRQIPSVQQSNEDINLEMQQSTAQQQVMHTATPEHECSSHEDSLARREDHNSQSGGNIEHSSPTESPQQPNDSHIAQSREEKAQTEDSEAIAGNNEQVSALTSPKNLPPLGEYTKLNMHQPGIVASAPLSVHTSDELVLLGPSLEAQRGTAIASDAARFGAPVEEAIMTEDRERRHIPLPESHPMEAGSSAETHSGNPIFTSEQAMATTDMSNVAKTEIDTQLLDSTNPMKDQTQISLPPVETRHQANPPPVSAIAQKSTAKSSQENTLTELKAQRSALLASLAALPKIKDLIAEQYSTDEASETSNNEPTDATVTAAAGKLVKRHIKLLHEYNEIKDVGQGLMGLIADQRGVRIVEVQEEFGLESND